MREHPTYTEPPLMTHNNFFVYNCSGSYGDGHPVRGGVIRNLRSRARYRVPQEGNSASVSLNPYVAACCHRVSYLPLVSL